MQIIDLCLLCDFWWYAWATISKVFTSTLHRWLTSDSWEYIIIWAILHRFIHVYSLFCQSLQSFCLDVMSFKTAQPLCYVIISLLDRMICRYQNFLILCDRNSNRSNWLATWKNWPSFCLLYFSHDRRIAPRRNWTFNTSHTVSSLDSCICVGCVADCWEDDATADQEPRHVGFAVRAHYSHNADVIVHGSHAGMVCLFLCLPNRVSTENEEHMCVSGEVHSQETRANAINSVCCHTPGEQSCRFAFKSFVCVNYY